MKHESRPAILMEKSWLTPWVGLYFGWDGVSGNLEGRATSVSQVYGVSDTAPACWLCDSVGRGLRKGTMASASTFVWEKAAL